MAENYENMLTSQLFPIYLYITGSSDSSGACTQGGYKLVCRVINSSLRDGTIGDGCSTVTGA